MGRLWRRGADVASVDSGARTAVLNLGNDRDSTPRILEGTAASIWRLIDGAHDTDGLVRELANSYGVNSKQIKPDVEAFLESLASEGLIS
ncbi:MAG: PqqD family protein [Cryobacterium sp.]|nr:PqqD family protein [Cryobacterium sp.]MCC7128595.1 PqqD family protein [Microbacteriaceae bacterium]